MAGANDEVRALLERLVGAGKETGIQVTAYLDGTLVIEAWAGIADEVEQRPVDGNTLFTGFSISKGITSTCVHILADRGLIDYDEPLATYWPEFAARGKARTTVGDVLSHRAGIPQDPPGFQIEMASDWGAVCRATADLEPLWEPGTRAGYHALTFGWILGELVRLVDGRPIELFLQQEVCEPLGIDSLYFGVPAREEGRVATLSNAPGLIPLELPLNPSLSDPASSFNRPEVRRAVIPGAGAILNARSLARHYAMLADFGELDGRRVLSRECIMRATRVQVQEEYRPGACWWHAHGLGYTLGGGAGPMERRPGGFGCEEGLGTIGFADPSRRFAFALLKNRLDWSAAEMETATLVERAAEAELGIA